VLTAFKDVSDSLADLDGYARQAVSETDAEQTASHAASLSRERYTRGLTDYLDVLEAERTQLQTQSQIVQIHSLQLISTVRLIKALGGGFAAHTLTMRQN
jgi:multidrug efflux system outer membrane protein